MKAWLQWSHKGMCYCLTDQVLGIANPRETFQRSRPMASLLKLTHWYRGKMVTIFLSNLQRQQSTVVVCLFNFYSNMYLIIHVMVHLTNNQPWFRLWVGADVVPSHYLNQRYHSIMTHICATGGLRLNSFCHSFQCHFVDFSFFYTTFVES